ncbi:hypothetical protein [Natrinema amylolyticum]|uniref:hypothetical protein n=1 Tax=Natrinema amylolyticum TaxID=2878679 RepID=UPI001CFB294B|nr:hypothetical protein [Natrinema amylolyticum]
MTAWPNGRPFEPKYVFETNDDHIRYRRDGAIPPLVAIETTLEWTGCGEETELRLRSVVEPTPLVPFLGRYVAWRRRRTLERLADRLATELGPADRRRVGRTGRSRVLLLGFGPVPPSYAG